MCEKATGKLREVQVLETQIFLEFKRICEKHNLKYFIEFGSLLGAIRHKGFIPWDDDVDVSMLYEDYVKFLEVAVNELGQEYFLQTAKTDAGYNLPYAKIRKNGTRMIERENADWDIHQGVWLDVFPQIEINDGFEIKAKEAIVEIYKILLSDDYSKIHKEEYKKRFGAFGMKILNCFYRIPKEKRINFAEKLIEKTIYSAKNKKYKATVWCAISKPVPKELYAESTMVEFEGEQFNAPKRYDERLRYSYGDYMQLPPVEQRIGHSADMIIEI